MKIYPTNFNFVPKHISEEIIAKYAEHNRKMPIKALRQQLLAKDPHCHWCGIQVRELNLGNLKKGQFAPDDMATIEHLYDRFEPEKRYQVYSNYEDKVLACFKCNTERSTNKHKSMTLKEKVERNRLGVLRKQQKSKLSRPIFFSKK